MGAFDIYIEKHGALVEQLALAAEQIPDDKVDWRPNDSALTWLRLVDHMAIARKGLVLAALRGEELNFPACLFDKNNHAKTGKEAAAKLREGWEELKGHLADKSDSYATELVKFTMGREMPVDRILWFAYDENMHHRGQMWVYARMHGLTPPKIWGSEEWDKKFGG
jgi:uncharacterized damage-inducible protein DinB